MTLQSIQLWEALVPGSRQGPPEELLELPQVLLLVLLDGMDAEGLFHLPPDDGQTGPLHDLLPLDLRDELPAEFLADRRT